MNNLPSTNPTAIAPEVISPEGLQVVSAYFENNCDLDRASTALGMPKEDFVKVYNRPEVKQYVSTIFNESGFRNRHKLFSLMDKIINMKLEQMDETGLGSDEDIVNILKTFHRMKMDEMKMEIELEKVRTAKQVTNVANQTNVQVINDQNYADLITKISGGGRR